MIGDGPCRLSVILAPSTPVGVVLRRGPSKWVQMIKWYTEEDRFEQGQWFRGRIYDRRCDLSPDGELFVYFASKFNDKTIRDREFTYAWTAVSRPPYFTALALWPKGDCWHGGGLFRDCRHLWLNHKPPSDVPHPKYLPRGLRVTANTDARGEDWPVWSERMKRGGWDLIQEGRFRSTMKGWATEQPEIWEQKHRSKSWTLRRSTDAIAFDNYGGPYLESFRLMSPAGEVVDVPGATWADWDRTGRLVFARAGKIFAGSFPSGRLVEKELLDLNANVPARVISPAVARKW